MNCSTKRQYTQDECRHGQKFCEIHCFHKASSFLFDGDDRNLSQFVSMPASLLGAKIIADHNFDLITDLEEGICLSLVDDRQRFNFQ